MRNPARARVARLTIDKYSSVLIS